MFSIGNEQTGFYPGILTRNLKLHIRHLKMIHIVFIVEIFIKLIYEKENFPISGDPSYGGGRWR